MKATSFRLWHTVSYNPAVVGDHLRYRLNDHMLISNEIFNILYETYRPQNIIDQIKPLIKAHASNAF